MTDGPDVELGEVPDGARPESASEADVPGDAPHVPGPGYWAGLQRRHRQTAMGVAAALLAALAIGAGLWVAFAGQVTGGDGPAAKRESTATASVQASATQAATPSVPATVAPAVTTTPTPVATAAPPPIAPVRAAFIAYRKDGAIWVASEGGGSPVQVAGSVSGAFALSPDGKRLAVVEGGSMKLTIHDVATGEIVLVGSAVSLRPEWSADSGMLVFSVRAAGGDSETVVRVGADGLDPVTLLAGRGPRFMADGKTVIAAPRDTPGGDKVVAVRSDGRSVTVAGQTRSEEVCPASTGVYFAEAGGLPAGEGFTPPSLRFVGYDGRGLRSVVATPSGGEHVAFSDLRLSPDGKWLAYAESGDDGYSRVFVVKTAGGGPYALKPHKDAYVLGWSVSGRELFLVEGNAVQGEKQSVTAIKPDGTGWREVVAGGGL